MWWNFIVMRRLIFLLQTLPVRENDTSDVMVLNVSGNSCHVYPTNWEKDRQLFLDQLNVSMTFLDRYYYSWSKSRIHMIPEKNSKYAALIGSEWVRVQVLSVDSTDCRAKVYSIDYGWTCNIPFPDFRPLPLDFIAQRSLCEEIFFTGDKPDDVKLGFPLTIIFHDKDDTLEKWRVSMKKPGGNDSQAAEIHFDNVNKERATKKMNVLPNKRNTEKLSNGRSTGNNSDWKKSNHKKLQPGGDEDKNGRSKGPSVDGQTILRPKEGKMANWGRNAEGPKNAANRDAPEADEWSSGRSPEKRSQRGRGKRPDGNRRMDGPRNVPKTAQSTKVDTPAANRWSNGYDGAKSSRTHGQRDRVPDGNRKVTSGGSSTKQVRWHCDRRLPPNESTVVVVYSGSEGTFVISESDVQNFESLENSLGEVSYNRSPAIPSINKLCLARYIDQKYYRAKVVNINPNEFKCEVLFVDYGNEDTVDFTDINDFPENIPKEIYTLKIDLGGPPQKLKNGTLLNVSPISISEDGTVKVHVDTK